MPTPLPPPPRRTFLQQLALGGTALWAGAGSARWLHGQATDAVTALLPGGRKLGVALAGLGSYSRGELAPALQQTRWCRLAGVVTGDREKGARWARQYQFSEDNIFHYDTMDRLKGHPEIDIIYVVTPPGLHREHVLRAAATGKHVICEKPMANTVAECDDMIRACRAAGVKLGIGYRLHYDPFHRELDRLAASHDGGGFTRMAGAHSFPLRRKVWRLEKGLGGGGPLMDVGIYIIQAACRAAAALPVAVTAAEDPKSDPALFAEVEETIRFTLEFPGGRTCEGVTSYAEHGNHFDAEGPAGSLRLRPAFSYRGIEGRHDRRSLDFDGVPQQALQMDDFAACVLTGRESPVAGEMGRDHMAIIEAIYEAARTGQRVPVRA